MKLRFCLLLVVALLAGCGGVGEGEESSAPVESGRHSTPERFQPEQVEETVYRPPRIEGSVELRDTLLGAEQHLYSLLVVGGRAVRLYARGGTLYGCILDLTTGVETLDMEVLELGEGVQYIAATAGERILVQTCTDAYLLDRELALVGRTSIPAGLFAAQNSADYLYKYFRVSDNLTCLVYSDDVGLFTVDLDGGGEPLLLREHPHVPAEADGDQTQVARYMPRAFLSDRELLTDVAYYEGAGHHQVIDVDTGLVTVPFLEDSTWVTALYFDGEMLAYDYAAEQHCHLDYSTGAVTELGFLPDRLAVTAAYGGGVNFCDSRHYAQGHSDEGDGVYWTLHRMHWEQELVEELPLKFWSSGDGHLEVYPLAVGEIGLVFSYSQGGMGGFGVADIEAG